VATRVSSLTQGKQTPDMEVRFDSTVFASSLQTTISQPRPPRFFTPTEAGDPGLGRDDLLTLAAAQARLR